jgi:hypothetical protein
VERCVARHRGWLRRVEPEPGQAEPDPQRQPQPQPDSDDVQPAGRFAERARRHALVHELIAQGHGIRAITRNLG